MNKLQKNTNSIKSITELRDFSLSILMDLRKGKIDIETAGVAGKLAEGVISGCKIQLEYHKALGDAPHIPFLEQDCKLIRATPKALKAIK